MKKTAVIITLALTLMAVKANAQDDDKIRFGMKLGANYSNVYDSEGEDFDANPKLGLATGIFVAIPVGKFVGLQPEILFSQKGFQASGRILGSTYNFTRTTSYLDVPLLVALRPVSFITIVAGPQFSYLINQRDVFANGTTTIAQEKEFENDNIRKNTLCFTGGVDININHLVLSGRGGWDFLSNRGDGTSSTPRYKNVWLQATVGYRF